MGGWAARAAVAVAATAAGCGHETKADEDHGQSCLSAIAPMPGVGEDTRPQPFAADAPVYVSYQTGCFSSSCSRDRVASCAIEVDGTTLRATTVVTWTDLSDSAGDGCTADCQFEVVSCDSPPLRAGDYVFQYGDKTRPLTIPSQAPGPLCLENN